MICRTVALHSNFENAVATKKIIKDRKDLKEILNSYYEESGVSSDDILYTS